MREVAGDPLDHAPLGPDLRGHAHIGLGIAPGIAIIAIPTIAVAIAIIAIPTISMAIAKKAVWMKELLRRLLMTTPSAS
jgi:hypothetical protein